MYKFKDVLLTGIALFAMLFGAGNLLFPPTLGLDMGSNWHIAAFSFILTGVGLPLLGIIAASFAGKSLENFSDRVSPLFSKFYSVALILAIGPLLALPRTGATAYGMTFYNLEVPSMGIKFTYLTIYFGIALFFAIKPNKVVDQVGAILTPILLLMLGVIIFRGVFFHSVPATPIVGEFPFKNGFIEGYFTVDALAGIVFSAVILNSIRNGRNLSKKNEISFLVKSNLIANFLLALVYAFLIYIGSTFYSLQGTDKVGLLVKLTSELLGSSGQIILSICVAGACLTTAIGLLATVGDYFSKLLKVNYKYVVIFTTVLSYIFSMFGVEIIGEIALPILLFLYPISIALIVLNLLKDTITNDYVYRGVVLSTGIISFYEGLMKMNIEIAPISVLYHRLPFNDLGLAWITPGILGGILGLVIFMCFPNKSKNKS